MRLKKVCINLIQPRGIHLCCVEHLPGRGQPVHVHPHDRRVQPRRLGYQAPSTIIIDHADGGQQDWIET